MIRNFLNSSSGGAVVVPVVPVVSSEDQQELVPDTPIRRSSRSRTKSPEPVVMKIPDPSLAIVPEEPEENLQESVNQTTTDAQMYEKIIDEMDVDEGTAQDVNEDELLAEPEESNVTSETPIEPTVQVAESENAAEEKMVTDDENRGTKRRSDSPSKGNTPKKRQRLPPPNVEDFVNDEDEPELDESSVQLSWCKLLMSDSKKTSDLILFF